MKKKVKGRMGEECEGMELLLMVDCEFQLLQKPAHHFPGFGSC